MTGEAIIGDEDGAVGEGGFGIVGNGDIGIKTDLGIDKPESWFEIRIRERSVDDALFIDWSREGGVGGWKIGGRERKQIVGLGLVE